MFIIDFDDTIFDTFRWKRERLFAPLERLGIPSEIVQETYTAIRNNPDAPYTHEAHADALARLGFPREKVKTVLAASLGDDFHTFVFDDARSFLEMLKGMGQSLILLTLGDPAFQRAKQEKSGLLDFFDHAYFPDRHKERAMDPIISMCNLDESMWFINDGVAQTQKVQVACPKIIPIMKVSPAHDRDNYVQSGFPYFDTLTEIGEYIKAHV
ncbi:MAG: HAD family hydrolase [Patescibacteria group bacterium]